MIFGDFERVCQNRKDEGESWSYEKARIMRGKLIGNI